MSRRLFYVGLAGGLASLATGALAAGSLAIGMTNDFAHDGVAVGFTYNYEPGQPTEEDALHQCRIFQEGAQAARNACKVVARFDGRCAAVALDPQPLTNGFGWAVADRQSEAEDLALGHCRASSTPDRVKFCQISQSFCDNPE
jgi:Domain of unknown function (DUF4189)